jgi:hypothetical protein
VPRPTRYRRQPKAGTSVATNSRSSGAVSGRNRTREGSGEGTTRAGRPSTTQPASGGWSVSGWRSKRSRLTFHGGSPSSGTRTRPVRGCGDGLKTAISWSSVNDTTPVTSRPASCSSTRRVVVVPSSMAVSYRAVIWSATRSREQPPTESWAWLRSRARHAERRAGRSSGRPSAAPSAAHGSVHPVSSVSQARLRSFRGSRADHTPGSWLAMRPPRSGPSNTPARSPSSSSTASSRSARRTATPAPSRRRSASTTGPVCPSGGR